MLSLRARRLALATLSLVATLATAQSLTPHPGSQGLGSGLSWNLRSNYQPGLKWAASEPRLEAATWPDRARTSLYADWFPFAGHSFRFVGGLTLNDTWSSPLGNGQGQLGGYNLQGGAYPFQLRPRTTTYLGVGYGSHGWVGKGLGFYADMGVSLGSTAELDSGLGGLPAAGPEGWRTQNNGWLGFRYLPSVSLGLIYRY
ncbi:MAG: hypothetical protein VW475_07170 [Curvibacter sp.]